MNQLSENILTKQKLGNNLKRKAVLMTCLLEHQKFYILNWKLKYN